MTDLACEGLHGFEVGDKKLIVQRANASAAITVPILDGALPGAGMGRALLPIEILGANGLKPAEPTSILAMFNLFDPVDIEADEFFNHVVEDIRLEVERFGTVHELYIPRPEKGKNIVGIGRVSMII
jgi:splicing factor U2AF subunit